MNKNWDEWRKGYSTRFGVVFSREDDINCIGLVADRRNLWSCGACTSAWGRFIWSSLCTQLLVQVKSQTHLFCTLIFSQYSFNFLFSFHFYFSIFSQTYQIYHTSFSISFFLNMSMGELSYIIQNQIILDLAHH